MMSALGQKQTFAVQKGMSALPPKADICSATRDVCFGPEGDITKKEAATVGSPKLISSHPFYMRRD
jgi:hypothetical protein